MTEPVIMSLIAAVPAVLGAGAAIIAARRSGTGNSDISEVKDMLIQHISDTSLHRQTGYPIRRVGK